MSQYIDPNLLYLTAAQIAQLPNAPGVPNPMPTSIGTFYTFQQAGAAITLHDHTDTNVHYTVVISGQFSVYRTNENTTLTLNPGDIVGFSANDPHSITCVQPGLILNGQRLSPNVGALGAQVAAIAANANALTAAITAAATAAATLTTNLAALPSTAQQD